MSKKKRAIKLERKDFWIMAELMGNSRMTLKQMAEKLDLPKSTIHSRIKRLEDLGVITNYSIFPDYRKMGINISAFIMISYSKEDGVEQNELANTLAHLPHVQEVHIIAGEWDLILKVRMRDIEELAVFTVKQLKEIKGVNSSLTYVTLQTVKDSSDAPYVIENI